MFKFTFDPEFQYRGEKRLAKILVFLSRSAVLSLCKFTGKGLALAIE